MLTSGPDKVSIQNMTAVGSLGSVYLVAIVGPGLTALGPGKETKPESYIQARAVVTPLNDVPQSGVARNSTYNPELYHLLQPPRIALAAGRSQRQTAAPGVSPKALRSCMHVTSCQHDATR